MNKKTTRKNKKSKKAAKKIHKRTLKKRTSGGYSSSEVKQQTVLRDTFRRMFNTLFNILISAQEREDAAAYEKDMIVFLAALKRHKTSINTLIPITHDYMPIDKKTYNSATTPLLGFVPFMSIMIYHLKNEKDLLRILIQFKRSSGNINLMSIKDEITALSTATDLGRQSTIAELLKRGADVNMLSEANQQKILAMGPFDVSTTEPAVVEQAAEPAVVQPAVVQPATVEPATVPPMETVFSAIEQHAPEVIVPAATPLNLQIPLPDTNGYPINDIPAFWAPIFHKSETELFDLRTRIVNIITNDDKIKLENNVLQTPWSICSMVQTMIPTYYVPTKKELYTQGGIMYNDLDVDFTHYNMILCACLIIFGILSDRMVGQDYDLVCKGGKAIQLVLAQIPNSQQYTSEDIDILVKPKENIVYNKDDIKHLACHVGYLIKWFLSATDITNHLSILLPETSENARRNPNIVKISYIKSTKRYDFRKRAQVDEYKPISDIDFKELPLEILPYFNRVFKYSFHIEELDTNVLFVCPYIGVLIDEKLYFYSKYMNFKLLLENGEKITEPGYENLQLADIVFYLNKFSRAILALSAGLIQQRNPDLSNEMMLEKQKVFINKRLDEHKVPEKIKTEVFRSLFLRG